MKEADNTDMIGAFAGVGTDYIKVITVPGKNNINFDPYFAIQGIEISPVNVGGADQTLNRAASVMDIASASKATPYHRLFYPTQPMPAMNVPSVNPADHPTIVSAPDYNTLSTWTAGFRNTPNCCDTDSGVCTIFFGRAAVIPEFKVIVNVSEEYVSVGTTLRNLVEQSSDAFFRPRTLKVKRYNSSTLTPINFESQLMGFDLPLAPGDQIQW